MQRILYVPWLVSALVVTGCMSSNEVQTDFGGKEIYIPPNTSLVLLRDILLDWEMIADAVYKQIWVSEQCSRADFSIENIVSVADLDRSEQNEVLAQAGAVREGKENRVFSVTVDAECLRSPGASLPAWRVVSQNGRYLVLTYDVIES